MSKSTEHPPGRMRAAYADPPYPGCAHLYPEKTEVDHGELVERLNTFDAWALSTSSTALQHVLSVCPEDVRVMAWVKPFASYKPNVNPAYAWEPLIVRGGRPLGRDVDTVRDWIAENITLERGLVGAKPAKVCRWVFDVLGLQPGDDFVDVFPGTGAVMAAWRAYCGEPSETPQGALL